MTVLDPLPERLEPGTPYTVGMWVLQHGSHPFEGQLGPVSLTLTGDQGQVTYPAVALIEPAHYAAAIVAPRPGTYKVVAAQGLFAPYNVGTLTVPGGFAGRGDAAAVAVRGCREVLARPGPPADHAGRPQPRPVHLRRRAGREGAGAAPSTPSPRRPRPRPQPASRTPLLAAAAVVVAGLALLLTNRQRRGRAGQRSGPSPSSSSMTWIAASSAHAPPPSTPASQATESASSSSPNPSSSSTSRPARGSVS